MSPIPQCPNCPPPTGQPTIVIPWYYCTATINATGPNNGTVSIPLMAQMIPATFDTNYVPAPILSVSAQGSNVNASVSVTGGTPPYSYSWGGSAPTATTNIGASITYTPTIRVGVPSLTYTVTIASVTIAWPY